MAQTTSVLWTADQGLGEEEKAQARKNIGLDSVGDNVKFSNTMNGVDLSNADLKIETTKITTPQTIQFYKLHIKNEYNSEQDFALVPLDAQGGFLYKMEEGPIVAKEIDTGSEVKAYNLGTSIYNSKITLSGQSSGTPLSSSSSSTSETVTLTAGKKYLITPSCYGSSEYTTTVNDDSTHRWSVEILLTDSNYNTTWNQSITLAHAQYYVEKDKGSRYSDYHFSVPITPMVSIIQPSTDLELNKIVIRNNGNVLGCNSSHTTKLFMDFDLGYVLIQEIK